jgi:enamine deaminase RidA (YjgF/YER057c/UK114 family)
MSTIINPPELATPRGYSHGVLAPAGGRLLFIGGQVGWDRDGVFAQGFIAQFEKALGNVLAVVRAAGGKAHDLTRLTVYVVDKKEYLADLKEVGAAYRRVLGRHFPAMALVEVTALVEDQARVEVEATAVIATEASR